MFMALLYYREMTIDFIHLIKNMAEYVNYILLKKTSVTTPS